MQMAARAMIRKFLAIFSSYALRSAGGQAARGRELLRLKRDAALAALDYVKPARHKPDRGR
jgi:hypothetical protein